MVESGHILLRSNATIREVLHEVGHFSTFRKLGVENYAKLSEPIKEHLASVFIRSRDAWKKLNPEEMWQELKNIDPDYIPTKEIESLLKSWGVI